MSRSRNHATQAPMAPIAMAMSEIGITRVVVVKSPSSSSVDLCRPAAAGWVIGTSAGSQWID